MSRPSGIAPTSVSSINTILLITLGDPNGIGPEVTAKSVRHFSARRCVILIGARAALDPWSRFLGRAPVSIAPRDLDAAIMALPKARARPNPPPGVYLIEPPHAGLKVRPGRISRDAANMAVDSLKLAAGLLIKNPSNFALVTAPLSKEACIRAGMRFSGHTGFLARAFGVRPLMLLMADQIRVGLVTEHIPLCRVSKEITSSNVLRALRTFAIGMSNLGIASDPVINVLGLNPHAGEGGKIGTEDGRIAAAIRAFNRLNIGRATGPVPADSAFSHNVEQGTFLAMYHDQGLIPVKMRGIARAVNITLGLPARRTSPAHGTAFDIAGRGIADPRSMKLAIEWAIRLRPPGP